MLLKQNVKSLASESTSNEWTFLQGYFASLGLAGVVIVVLATLSLTVKGFSGAHMNEDQTVEMCTAVIFLLAGVIAIIAAFKAVRCLAVVIGVLGLLFFLDEMSFGERHFGLTMPVIHGVKIDAVHDLLALSLQLIGDPALYLTLALAMTVLAVLVATRLFRHSATIRSIAADPATPFLAAALTLGVFALLLDAARVINTLARIGQPLASNFDLHLLVDFLKKAKIEEAAEFTAALCMLAAALVLLFRSWFGKENTA
jgi:hypothetical protein